ncbi:type IV toxin-antitoxin system AbiEi family antitoxin domain-containing protein [uncultured Jatrophihabitans sp.]|uniref:type IV toxin-antitoxin system AbiEi family antitoxin domain-containing protein n=1 Tax=uncultured Jatrophihabitans sp. TaxID=1610747 RepID=UPI0035CB7232
MREFPAIGAAQFDVFTAAQAGVAGWTSHALRHAVTIGRLDRLRPGVYAPPVPPSGNRFADAEQRLRHCAVAVALTNPGLALSHAAAASLRGIAFVEIPTYVCATTLRGRRGEVHGVHLHRVASLSSAVQRRGPVVATSPARTVLDLGREHGVDACIAAGDSAVRLGLTTAAELVETADRCERWPGIAAARRTVSLVDPHAESVLESLSRLRIVTCGLPLPLT